MTRAVGREGRLYPGAGPDRRGEWSASPLSPTACTSLCPRPRPPATPVASDCTHRPADALRPRRSAVSQDLQPRSGAAAAHPRHGPDAQYSDQVKATTAQSRCVSRSPAVWARQVEPAPPVTSIAGAGMCPRSPRLFARRHAPSGPSEMRDRCCPRGQRSLRAHRRSGRRPTRTMPSRPPAPLRLRLWRRLGPRSGPLHSPESRTATAVGAAGRPLRVRAWAATRLPAPATPALPVSQPRRRLAPTSSRRIAARQTPRCPR